MQDTIHVKGLAELGRVLQELPVKLERNVLRGAMRAGVNPMRDHARMNVAQASGLLAKSLKVSTRSQGGKVYAYLRTSGKHSYLANWIEFGTAAHRIFSRTGKRLRFVIDGKVILAKEVAHPGSRAIPFMRPAFDSQQNAAVVAVANYIKNRLSTKHGIDTSDIEVDEQ